jgi:GT2 family glycosyltransferase
MSPAFCHAIARLAAALRPPRRYIRPWAPRDTIPGISVVIPSRNGRHLLAAQLPGIVRELDRDSEIIVVDNGSDDGTAEWLSSEWPQIRVLVSDSPLSFARAVNRGIAAVRFSHVCLLNNDMLLEPGFFRALSRAFVEVPDLFCATAQIFFPEGARREETGKAVFAPENPAEFPIRCDEPLPGEDLTWVLYGSGGCSLYDADKLRALGGIDQAYEPAYVEDLDIGYRAWQRGWPSVYVAGARLEHRHRATSSRYFTDAELDEILEINYLKFLARAVSDPALFRRMWRQNLDRLRLRGSPALCAAWRIALECGAPQDVRYSEEALLAFTGGGVFVIPGGTPDAGVLVTSDEHQSPESYAAVVLVRESAGPLAFRAAFEEAARRWGAARVHSRVPTAPSR